MDPSTTFVFPGEGWTISHPEQDIISIAFRAWTLKGQLVESFPEGRIYYVEHGLPLLFPINLLFGTPLPTVVFDEGLTPVLNCLHELEPVFDNSPVSGVFSLQDYYPHCSVLRTIGPAINIHLFPREDDNAEYNEVPAVLTIKKPVAKAVNAFIAYRSK